MVKESNQLDIVGISLEMTKEANDLFGPQLVVEAQRLLKKSAVSISYKKTTDSYYIVSGIVKDDRIYESKITYKSRLKDLPEGPLSTLCNCRHWQNDKRCIHTAALFLNYKQILLYENQHQDDILDGKRPIGQTDLGVHTDIYGTMISAPYQLEGAFGNSTYSGLQYLLRNGKIINFPIPTHFCGKLVVNVKLLSNPEGPFLEIVFHYENQEGVLVKEISLFETLYLFNWNNGDLFHIPDDLKLILKRLRNEALSMTFDELIEILSSPNLNSIVAVMLDGKYLASLQEKMLSARVSMVPSEKKNYLIFSLCFFDDGQDLVISPPLLMRMFAFKGGGLLGFRRKIDSYDFISAVLENISGNENSNYKRFLQNNKNKDLWLNVISYFLDNEKSTIYERGNEKIYSYLNKDLKILLAGLFKNFGEQFFRFSEYDASKKELRFEVMMSTIFSGINSFYAILNQLKIPLYFDRNEVGAWSGGKIRFERKKSLLGWFDLDLNITQSDLEIIKGADLETGVSLSSKGLILLTPEQKDMVRLMQKYLKYEEQGHEEIHPTDGLASEIVHKFVLPFNRTRIFELFELKKLGVSGALTLEEEEFCNRLMNMTQMPSYELPQMLDGVLRPYQVTGFNWLRFLYEHGMGACLADDMGLGKTIQAIAFIKSISESIERVLIICPITILLNWEKEIRRFSDMDVYIYHGGAREFPDNVKIVLTSYGVMKKETDTVFAGKKFDVLILDEVQHLKNIRTMGAYYARKINAKFRICLTGTPVENDLSEFYNIIDLAIPGIWGDLHFIRSDSSLKSRFLARKTAKPFILRRTKAQVLTDLPPKVENNVFLHFNDEEREVYEANLLRIRSELKDASSKQKYGAILKGLLLLRQNCLWQKNSAESTKVKFLLETLEQVIQEGHKTIVFSQFTTYLDLIQKAVLERNWRIARIDGTQNVKKRQKQVDLFQNNQADVFLISLKAGGVGLNLTAASYVFIMDPWWNPAVEVQAIDRAHRIGQENKLTVYRPIIKHSVEEKVLELQAMKKQLFLDLLPDSDENYFSGKLTMQDFEMLFY